MQMAYLPFIKIAAVGLVAHVIERKLERSGNGAHVLYVRIGTYVACALITWAEWGEALRRLGNVFGLHAGW